MKIVITVLSLLLFLGTGVCHETYKKNLVPDQAGKQDTLSELLKEFNLVDVHVVSLDNQKRGTPYRIVVLGNSLSYHGRAEQIGWNYDHGMAASAPSRDYVHLLFDMIEKNLPERRIQMLVYNIADFERNFDTFDFKQLASLKKFSPR